MQTIQPIGTEISSNCHDKLKRTFPNLFIYWSCALYRQSKSLKENYIYSLTRQNSLAFTR